VKSLMIIPPHPAGLPSRGQRPARRAGAPGPSLRKNLTLRSAPCTKAFALVRRVLHRFPGRQDSDTLIVMFSCIRHLHVMRLRCILGGYQKSEAPRREQIAGGQPGGAATGEDWPR